MGRGQGKDPFAGVLGRGRGLGEKAALAQALAEAEGLDMADLEAALRSPDPTRAYAAAFRHRALVGRSPQVDDLHERCASRLSSTPFRQWEAALTTCASALLHPLSQDKEPSRRTPWLWKDRSGDRRRMLIHVRDLRLDVPRAAGNPLLLCGAHGSSSGSATYGRLARRGSWTAPSYEKASLCPGCHRALGLGLGSMPPLARAVSERGHGEAIGQDEIASLRLSLRGAARQSICESPAPGRDGIDACGSEAVSGLVAGLGRDEAWATTFSRVPAEARAHLALLAPEEAAARLEALPWGEMATCLVAEVRAEIMPSTDMLALVAAWDRGALWLGQALTEHVSAL